MLFGQQFGIQAFASPIPSQISVFVAWEEVCPTPSEVAVLPKNVVPWDPIAPSEDAVFTLPVTPIVWDVLERPTVDIIPENDPDLPDVDQLWLEQRRSISGRSIERC